MTGGAAANGLVLVVTALALLAVFLPRVRRNAAWRATVTPLASIIGSGFLVLAPLLVREFGSRAVWVMAALCALAYAIGAAIRWNILALDGSGAMPPGAAAIDRLASWALAFAYVISVCYYLNLFGAFAVSLTPWDGDTAGRIVTTAVLAFIAGVGWWRGLRGLERAEALTVSLKLAVIAGLLAGLAVYAWGLDADGGLRHDPRPLGWNALTLAFGLIITVQGFETSRYLSAAYDAATRVRTMRYAQWLSAVIYLAYIGLAGVSFPARDVPLEETAVIDMMAPVAAVLPALLVLAALAAQFSAATADTNGCGGLLQEVSKGRVSARVAYVALAATAVTLTWTADIYAIISYASRAFAAYYTLQAALAAVLARREGKPVRAAAFAALAVVVLAATVFGRPAE